MRIEDTGSINVVRLGSESFEHMDEVMDYPTDQICISGMDEMFFAEEDAGHGQRLVNPSWMMKH